MSNGQYDICRNCGLAEMVLADSRVIFICKSSPSFPDQWYAVNPNGKCKKFEDIGEISNNTNGGDGVRLIPLTKGRFAKVDACDYYWLSRFRWSVSGCKRNVYAARKSNGKGISMHRVITGVSKGMVVDHINHNGLDNRRENLRVCTAAENSMNARARRGQSSKYKGVSFHKSRGKYCVFITHKCKTHFVGRFTNEEEAARAYDAKAKQLHGEFACLNFP